MMQHKLIIVAAAGLDDTIGYCGMIPWRLPADMKMFKKITANGPLIMGRKTYESIGSRPLIGRKNVVITRTKYQESKDVAFCSSLEEAINECGNVFEIFIIGGSEIYKQTIDIAEKIFLTRVNDNFEGDTFFPTIDPRKWKEVYREDKLSDSKNKYDYSFLEYVRI